MAMLNDGTSVFRHCCTNVLLYDGMLVLPQNCKVKEVVQTGKGRGWEIPDLQKGRRANCVDRKAVIAVLVSVEDIGVKSPDRWSLKFIR